MEAPVRRRRWPLGLAAVLTLTAVQLLRQPGTPTWNTVWAEDGRIYATDATGSGWAGSLFRGYAGYVQVLPRLLALPLRLLPVTWWAAWLAVAAAVVSSLLAAFVYRAAAGHISSPLLRALLAAMTAVAPSMWFEANANVANLGWPLLFASFWALVSSDSRPTDVVLRTVVLVLAALTTTLAALYVPLAALLLVRRRRRRAERWIVGSFLAALAVQAIADLAAPPGPSEASSVADVPKLFAVRVMGSVAFGERWLERLWLRLHWTLAVALVVLGSVALVALLRAAGPRTGRLAVVATLYAGAMFALPVWLRGSSVMRLGADYNAAGSRYVVVPALLLTTALVCCVDRVRTRGLRAVVAAHLVLVMATSLGMTNPRSDGPGWKREVERAAARCPTAVTAFESIPITPPEEPWYVRTSCDRLR